MLSRLKNLRLNHAQIFLFSCSIALLWCKPARGDEGVKHGSAAPAEKVDPTQAEACQEEVPIGMINTTRSNVFHDGYAKLSPDAKSLLTPSDNGTSRIIEVSTGKVLSTFEQPSPYYRKEFSPDGKSLAMVSQNGAFKIIKIVELSTGKILSTFEQPHQISSFVFSPDGKSLAIVSQDGTGKTIEISTGKVLSSIQGIGAIESVVFSRDGKYLAATANYDTASVIEAASGKVISTIRNPDWIIKVAFSPDGKSIATISRDGTAKFTELSTGKVSTLEDSNPNSISSAELSPDGKSLVTGSVGSSMKISDVSTGNVLSNVRQSYIDEAVFSPDGKYLATALGDGITNLTEVSTGNVLSSIQHSSRIDSVAFSPDSQSLAIASHDGKLSIVKIKNICRRPEDYNVQLASNFSSQAAAAKLAAFPEGFCQSLNLSQEKWDQFVDPALSKTGLSLETAYKLLYRFQKPGGFDPALHTPVLLSLLESPLAEKEPAMVAAVLQNVFLSSYQLYNYIVSKYPKLISSLSPGTTDPQEKLCRSEEDQKRIAAAVQTETTRVMHAFEVDGGNQKLGSLDRLIPLKSALPETPRAATVESLLAKTYEADTAGYALQKFEKATAQGSDGQRIQIVTNPQTKISYSVADLLAHPDAQLGTAEAPGFKLGSNYAWAVGEDKNAQALPLTAWKTQPDLEAKVEVPSTGTSNTQNVTTTYQETITGLSDLINGAADSGYGLGATREAALKFMDEHLKGSDDNSENRKSASGLIESLLNSRFNGAK